VHLYVALAAAAFAVVALGAATRVFPAACLAALAAVPLLVLSARRARTTYERPREFVAAIRSIVACYLVGAGLFTAGVVAGAWA
jgi:1,4-dihydroxy-2-naphthoate octaprenyltransferase